MAEIKKSDKKFAVHLCSFGDLVTQRNGAILFRFNYLSNSPFIISNSFWDEILSAVNFSKNIFGKHEHMARIRFYPLVSEASWIFICFS